MCALPVCLCHVRQNTASKFRTLFCLSKLILFFLRLRSSGAGSALLPSNARLDKSPCGSTSRRPAPGGLAKAVGNGPATADLRGAMTFLAAICDQAHVQPKLPQLIIGNKAKLTQTVLKNASRHKPQAVHLQVQTSAWNNRGTVAKNLGLLGDSLFGRSFCTCIAGLRDVPFDARRPSRSSAARATLGVYSCQLRDIPPAP